MIARVFPRRTPATPIDDYAFIGPPGFFIPEDVTEVHVSVTFTWDKPVSERLAEMWSQIAPVKIGGPAYDDKGDTFTAGLYLKQGYTITSRGCDNNCWFCLVPKREGKLRELPIVKGNNLLDNNILGCSEAHIKSVFKMLRKQSRVMLTGGLEAKLLKQWHVELIEKANVRQTYFAYDTPDDLPPLVDATKLLKASQWYRWRKCGCYVLIGYPKDTIDKATERLETVLKLGYMPFAMFYRDAEGKQNKNRNWAKLQREWTRPAIINATRNRLLGEVS